MVLIMILVDYVTFFIQTKNMNKNLRVQTCHVMVYIITIIDRAVNIKHKKVKTYIHTLTKMSVRSL